MMSNFDGFSLVENTMRPLRLTRSKSQRVHSVFNYKDRSMESP